MTYRLKRIAVLQTSMIVGILYAILGILFIPFGLIFMLMPDMDEARFMGLIYLFAPFVYGALGFLFTALFCALYNLLASKLGGIEFTLAEQSEPGQAGGHPAPPQPA